MLLLRIIVLLRMQSGGLRTSLLVFSIGYRSAAQTTAAWMYTRVIDNLVYGRNMLKHSTLLLRRHYSWSQTNLRVSSGWPRFLLNSEQLLFGDLSRGLCVCLLGFEPFQKLGVGQSGICVQVEPSNYGNYAWLLLSDAALVKESI